MQRLPMLLLGHAAIAVSLLGGCASLAGGAGGNGPRTDREPAAVAPRRTSAAIVQAFAMAALDDRGLGTIRGGLDTSSGVQLSFAFQQATYLNHSLVQTVIVPTLTLSQNMAGLAASPALTTTGGTGSPGSSSALSNLNLASSATPATSAAHAAVSVTSPNGFGVSGPSLATSTVGNTTTILSGGSSQTQTVPGVQSLAGNGTSSILTTLGSGGVTNVVSNTANNQLVQQVTSVDIGVSGFSKLVQSGVSASVMNRLTPGAASFR